MNEVKCSAAIPYPSRDLGSDAVNETYGIAVVKLPRAPPHKYVLSRKSLAFDYTPNPSCPQKHTPADRIRKHAQQGCVIIFLSNFLALLIKVDAGEANDRDVFGAVMVAVNVLLVLAVLVTSWFATQQSVDDSRNGEQSPLAIAKTMPTAEQDAAIGARLTRNGSARRFAARRRPI